VVSGPAIHSIPDAAGRARAIAEAVRVLRPGGQRLIPDFRVAGELSGHLAADRVGGRGDAPLGMALLVRRPAGVKSTILSAR
jgi:hypothetical protein